MDDDAVWKAQATSNIDQLRAAVQHLLQCNKLPELAKFAEGSMQSPQIIPTPSRPVDRDLASHSDWLDERPAVSVEHESELVPAPMSNLYNLTESRHPQSTKVAPTRGESVDILVRGTITIEEAEYLFNYYRKNINSLLWGGILCQHKTLQDARQSSAVLTAAVITVAALHAPDQKKILPSAYDEFVSISGSDSLSRSHNLDDIRGLCIGAFYLTNLSWRLTSQAVRMATEVNLHQASLSLLRGYSDLKTHERMRLWYVLYICDHQFAIAYGRPPIMHDDGAIRSIDKFLANQLISPGDIRLAGQVKIQQILSEVYFFYGCDPDLALNTEDYERLRSFNISLDQWRLTWVPKSVDMPLYGTYPSRSKVLYYQFARFHLNSLSLRGLSARRSSEQGMPADLSWDRREAANAAILAATSTMQLVVEEADIHRALVGVPIFTHTMIAMCASFLIKMAVVFGKPLPSSNQDDQQILVPKDLSRYGLNFYTADALKLVEDLVDVLIIAAENVSQRHLVYRIVMGLKELLQHFVRDGDSSGFLYSRLNNAQTVVMASSGLVPARPTSRNGYSREHSMPNINIDDVDVNLSATQNGGCHFEQYIYGHDPLYMNLNWSIEDGFLWPIDEQATQF